jgi:hypothetical protein
MKNCFTKAFKTMQEKLGYTNIYIAKNLGVKSEVIALIRNGDRLPTPQQFVFLDKHMGFSQVGISEEVEDEIMDNLEYLTLYEKLKVLYYINKFVDIKE